MTGKLYGRYVLENRIAMGGMAEIFAARTRTEGFEKRVCIKRILPHFLENEEFVTMFRDEARTAAKLQHANVVQVFDFGEEEGTLYLAMELVDGSDLRRLLETGRKRGVPLDVGAAVQIAIDMCKGLHHAHNLADGGRALGIVHRDISPHNVLVSKAGEVKITDFGIARAAERATHTSTGMVKGKVAYMAPEQAQGLAFDHRLDQFATGVVLWEMLTGRRLFSADNDVLTLKKVLLCEVPMPSSIRPDVPAALDEVVVRALKEHAADRFDDMRQLELALQRVFFSGAIDPATADVRLAYERIVGDQPLPSRKTALLHSDSVKAALAPSEPLASPIESLPPPAMTESHSGLNAPSRGAPPSSEEGKGGVSVVFSSSEKAPAAPGPHSGQQAPAPRAFTEVDAHGPDPNARTVMEEDPRALGMVPDPVARSMKNAPAPASSGAASVAAGPSAEAQEAPLADVTATATPSARRAVASSAEGPLPSVSELERLEAAAQPLPLLEGTPATRTAVPRAEPLPPTLRLDASSVEASLVPGPSAGPPTVEELAFPGRTRRGLMAAAGGAAALAVVVAVVLATQSSGPTEPAALPQTEAVLKPPTDPPASEPTAIASPASGAPSPVPAVVPSPGPAAPAPAATEAPTPATVTALPPASPEPAAADPARARPRAKGRVIDVLVRSPRYSGFLYVGGERYEVSPQGNVYRLPVGKLAVKVQRGDGAIHPAQISVEAGKPTMVTLE